MAEKKSSFKVEIDSEVLKDIRELFDRKKIGYWDGTEGLFRWFLAQDPMFQSMVLGQIDETYEREVAQMVLERLAAAQTAKTKFGKYVANPIKPLGSGGTTPPPEASGRGQPAQPSHQDRTKQRAGRDREQ